MRLSMDSGFGEIDLYSSSNSMEEEILTALHSSEWLGNEIGCPLKGGIDEILNISTLKASKKCQDIIDSNLAYLIEKKKVKEITSRVNLTSNGLRYEVYYD